MPNSFFCSFQEKGKLVSSFVAFETGERAHVFEIFLKSGSGHAFAKRHY